MGQTYSYAISLEHEMVHSFCLELALSLFLASKYLIAVGPYFSEVVNHARTIERACI